MAVSPCDVAVDCVRRGKYQDFLNVLGSSLFEASLLEEWKGANNSLVCRFKLATKDEDIKDNLRSLEELLCQVKGVPLTSEVIDLYCTVVHNVLHLQVLIHTHKNTKPEVLEDLVKLLQQALLDVCEHCAIEVPRSDQSLHSLCFILIDNHTQLKHSTAVLVYDAALLLLLQRKPGLATQVLTALTQTLNNKESSLFDEPEQQPQYLILLCLPCDPSDPSFVVRSQMHDLLDQALCVTYLHNGEHELCLQCLKERENKHGNLKEDFIYMKAWCEWRCGNIQACISICHRLVSHSNCQSSLKARLRNLIGCCFTKQGKPQSAIQQFQSALNLDVTYMSALYNISLQYRLIGAHDAELECLSLIVKSFKSGILLSSSLSSPTVTSMTSALLQLHMQSELTHSQILYTLANRCMQLERYEVACSSYNDLISLLKSPDLCFSQKYVPEISGLVSQTVLQCPGIERVYTELAYCELCEGRYRECVQTCDQVIEGMDSTTTDVSRSFDSHLIDDSGDDNILSMLSGEQTCTSCSGNTQQQKNRKRALTMTETTGCVHECLLYKSEALFHCGGLDAALQCLTSLRESLETSNEFIPLKKQNSEAEKENHTACMLSQVHLNMCSILIVQGLYSEAVYHSRIAVIYTPDLTTAHYSHTIVLLKLSRDREAAYHWLKHRSVDIHQDSLQLAKTLDEKMKTSRNNDGGSPASPDQTGVTSTDFDHLDICCLKILTKYNHR